MAAAETARLIASLELKDKFSPTIAKANRGLGLFDSRLDKSGTRALRAGQQIGTGIKNAVRIAAVGVGLLATQVIAGVGQLVKLEKATAQTNAVLKSTKGVAGQTTESVRKLAEAYENVNATIDDKVIQSTENLLLTFTNIRGKAFEPTLKAILDMNTAMGGDENSLKSVVIQVGKALNDPTKGLTALRRVGVAFTKDQEKKIKSLQKEGKLYEAQQLILKELGKEFGGSFAAQGATAAGVMAGIGDAVEDLQTLLAKALFPTIQKVLPRIREFLQSDKVIAGVKDLGESIASLFSDENINQGAAILESLIGTAKAAAPVIAATAKTVAGFVKASVGVFTSMPKELQALIVGGFAVNKITGGLVTNLLGGIAGELFKRGSSPANPLFVTDVTGGLGKGVGGAAGALGGGAVATIAALAVPVAIAVAAQAGSKLLADQMNRLAPPGTQGNVQAPTLDPISNIPAAINNLIYVIKNWGGPKTPKNMSQTPNPDRREDAEIIKVGQKVDSTGKAAVHATLDVKGALAGMQTRLLAGQRETTAKASATALEVQRKGEQTVGQVRSSSSQNAATITAAIRANRPTVITNVSVSATTVNKTTTVVKRYGQTGGSRNQDSNGSGTLGNGGQ